MGKIQEIRESETGKKIVKKGKSGIGRILFGRTGVIMLLLLLQLGILFMVFSRLQQHVIYVYWLFALLSALTAILIINRPGNPAFKLAWMVPITIFPVFGMLLYLFVEFQAGERLLNRRLQDVEQQMRKYVLQDPDVFEELERTDKRTSNLSRYVMEKGGFPTYKNYHTAYYPWGKDKFEALIKELNKAEKFIFMEYFIVAEGKMWNTVLEILKKKVQEGVEVRFMYDGTCSISLLPYNYPKKLEEYGIPYQRPAGGHAIFIDAPKVLTHVPQEEFPAQTLTVELYLEAGIRGCEIGYILADRDPVTHENRFNGLDLLRLAIPRRVYTDNHMNVIAAALKNVYERRESITHGVRIAWEAPLMRHFTVQLERL